MSAATATATGPNSQADFFEHRKTPAELAQEKRHKEFLEYVHNLAKVGYFLL